jgi:hypothetical protein
MRYVRITIASILNASDSKIRDIMKKSSIYCAFRTNAVFGQLGAENDDEVQVIRQAFLSFAFFPRCRIQQEEIEKVLGAPSMIDQDIPA